MRRLAAPALVWAVLFSSTALAQQVVVSPGPDKVSVTAYRAPDRSADQEIDLAWPEGFALISEQRTVSLPAGDVDIRFEGVAGTILPQSVIIRGLPGDAREKNYDARLLSPGALIEQSLGRLVHLRRTSKATGKVTEEEALIRSGPSGVVIQSARGVEALRCSGLPETLVYSGVPDGLSDRPTLSIRARLDAPTTVTLSLAYIAGLFDWQADYVARVDADGKTMSLFAWVSIANGNDESFADADVQTVAGEPGRDEDNPSEPVEPYAPSFALQCWPQGTTSDVGSGLPPPPPPPPPAAEMDGGDDIVVTGSRMKSENLDMAVPVTAITAQQEDLGDLKLYRIPEPVTVSANGQKQVAMLSKAAVKIERIYAAVANATNDDEEPQPLTILIRALNRKDSGLGLPLPMGRASVFEPVGGETMFAGSSDVIDTPVGERLELLVGQSPDVQFVQTRLDRDEDEDKPKSGKSKSRKERMRMRAEISNARSAPADVELGLSVYDNWNIVKSSERLVILDGRRTWKVRVPANGKSRLTYTVERPIRNDD